MTDQTPIGDSYQASPLIRYCVVDDLVVVLDLRQGQYLMFDETASYIWLRILSVRDRAQRVYDIAQRFGISLSQGERDMDSFLETCLKRGFFAIGICRTPRSTIKIERVSPNSLNAWKCLYRTRRSLARLGFAGTYDLHLQMAETERSMDRGGVALATAVRAFHRAENLLPMRDAPNDCLSRSLGLHRFLLTVGIDAAHCIGVRRFPFGAHAWVEVANKIVCDSAEFRAQFTIIARV